MYMYVHGCISGTCNGVVFLSTFEEFMSIILCRLAPLLGCKTWFAKFSYKSVHDTISTQVYMM